MSREQDAPAEDVVWMQRLGRLLYAVKKVCNARRAEMDLVAAAHAASASTEWTFDDLLAGELSPAAQTSARLLAAAAAGQLSRQPGKGGFQPMPVRRLALPTLSLIVWMQCVRYR